MKVKNLSFLSFIISIISLISSIYFSHKAITMSSEANAISKIAIAKSDESIQISWKNRNDEVELRSSEKVEKLFDDLYRGYYSGIIWNVRKNINVENMRLQLLVDEFEGLGSDLCRGIVNVGNLKTKLKITIGDLCKNDQIYNSFGGRKNGFAMLCFEFFPESKFADFLAWKNLNTCNFIDTSNLTKETINMNIEKNK